MIEILKDGSKLAQKISSYNREDQSIDILLSMIEPGFPGPPITAQVKSIPFLASLWLGDGRGDKGRCHFRIRVQSGTACA